MSNRPSRKASHSAKARVQPAPSSSGGSRVWWIVGAAVVVVVLVGAVAFALTRSSSSPTEPVLDAQATRGKQVATEKGCVSCHTSNGNRAEGPTWKGLYGSSVTLTDGTTVTADDAYLTRSIRQPGEQVVSGYKAGSMSAVPLSDDELAALLAYLKALK